LGAGRYFRRRKRGRHTNANTHSHSNGHCNGNCYSHRNGIADGHAATKPNPQVGSFGKTASHASAAAVEFAEPRVFFVIGNR
jgi:hypothetical protein